MVTKSENAGVTILQGIQILAANKKNQRDNQDVEQDQK